MVLGTGVALVRAAPNSLPRSGRWPSRASGCPAEAWRLWNLSVPTGRSLKTHGSIPRGGDGWWPATRGGFKSPVARGSGTKPHPLG